MIGLDFELTNPDGTALTSGSLQDLFTWLSGPGEWLNLQLDFPWEDKPNYPCLTLLFNERRVSMLDVEETRQFLAQLTGVNP